MVVIVKTSVAATSIPARLAFATSGAAAAAAIQLSDRKHAAVEFEKAVVWRENRRRNVDLRLLFLRRSSRGAGWRRAESARLHSKRKIAHKRDGEVLWRARAENQTTSLLRRRYRCCSCYRRIRR